MRLIVATSNKNKLKEIRQILSGLNLPIVCLADLRKKVRIVENAKTFAGNAAKKALPVSKLYPKDLVLGEDSGLAVDYLKGAPGVRSKRYASASGDQERNNVKLLKALAAVPASKRRCRFYCVLTVAQNGTLLQSFEGVLSGEVAGEPAGGNGFGYDPVFYLPQYKKTVAQLPLSLKNRISHRAKAFRQLKKYLTSRKLSAKK
jgi:XTP/dITP diphosphohydrolase